LYLQSNLHLKEVEKVKEVQLKVKEVEKVELKLGALFL
jgi:hypothetical protein